MSKASVFISGGGAIGKRLREFDWSTTPLGPIPSWSASLRITVDLMMSSDVPSCLFWGPDLIAIYNDGYSSILGEKPEALGEPMRVTWAEAWGSLEPIASKALNGESTFIENYPLEIQRSGTVETAYFTFCYSPVFDENGNIIGMLDTVIETTGNVLGQIKVQEERDRQQRMLQQMPGFTAVLRGPDHVYEYFNEAYNEIAGGRELMGRTVKDAFSELEGQGYFEMLDKVYSTGVAIRANASPIRLAGETRVRYIDFLYEPIREKNDEVSGIFVGGYDVTVRVEAERTALASEAHLLSLNAELERRVIERTMARGRAWQVSPELLSVITVDGFVEAANPAWEKTLGWSESEMTRNMFMDRVHPDDLAITRKAWDEVGRRGAPLVRFECRYMTKGGSWLWLSWVAVPEEGKVYCITRDVQAEKDRAAALMETQEALRQAQKMEAVGQLTGGIAHDFNNLLAAISGSLQVLRLRLERGKLDGIDKYLDMGERSVKRAASLTQRLLAFSRRQTLDPKAVDVNRLVAGMEDLISRTVGPSVSLQVQCESRLWSTRVDSSQLENALLNLCINARDAMLPEGGLLSIETFNTTLDDPKGEYVLLRITDSGSGMSADVIERIFDPFFTTKPIGQGTGLGLSMVYGFVRQSGGQVKVDSEPGRGTTMSIYLPRYVGDAEADAGFSDSQTAESGEGEKILLIEDEPILRELISEVMVEAGYRLVLAEDGPSGLKRLQENADIDLLITDVGLPGGLNGRQVADAGRVLRPELKVLFITGYADTAAVGNGLMEPGMDVLTKPFEMAAAVNKVRQMLQ